MGDLLRIEKWAENLEEVTLSRWLKPVGSHLQVGDTLCEIITDKATFEYEIERAGTLRQVYATEQSVLPIGYAIAFVGSAEELLPEGVEEANAALVAARQVSVELVEAGELAAVRQALAGKRVRATPAARRVAREQGISLEEVAAWLGTESLVDEIAVQRYREAKGE